MPVTEDSRHRLHQALDQAIGPEEATTLMEHLPPVGWADVATKQDLAHLQEAIDHRFEMVELRFDRERTHVDHRFDMVELRFDKAQADSEHLFATNRLDIKHITETMAAHAAATNERLDLIVGWMTSMEKRLTVQFWQLLGLFAAFGAILVGVLRYT